MTSIRINTISRFLKLKKPCNTPNLELVKKIFEATIDSRDGTSFSVCAGIVRRLNSGAAWEVPDGANISKLMSDLYFWHDDENENLACAKDLARAGAAGDDESAYKLCLMLQAGDVQLSGPFDS